MSGYPPPPPAMYSQQSAYQPPINPPHSPYQGGYGYDNGVYDNNGYNNNGYNNNNNGYNNDGNNDGYNNGGYNNNQNYHDHQLERQNSYPDPNHHSLDFDQGFTDKVNKRKVNFIKIMNYVFFMLFKNLFKKKLTFS